MVIFILETWIAAQFGIKFCVLFAEISLLSTRTRNTIDKDPYDGLDPDDLIEFSVYMVNQPGSCELGTFGMHALGEEMLVIVFLKPHFNFVIKWSFERANETHQGLIWILKF